MDNNQLDPEQLAALKKLKKETDKKMIRAITKLFAMLFFFSGTTLIVGVLFVQNSPEFIFLGNFVGGILALSDANKEATAITKKYVEDKQKILRGLY